MLENKKNKLHVAVVQMQSQQVVEENYLQAVKLLMEAIYEHNAELVIFPENFLCLGISDYFSASVEILFYVNELSKLAEQHSVYLLLGSVPYAAKNHKCFSRSILINSSGVLVGSYDKVHLFDVEVGDRQGSYKESDSFLEGAKPCVLPVEFSKLGLSICYDLRFPELFQLLRKSGAEMIAVPSAFTYKTGKAHWEILLRARAIETQSYILASNQCGSHLIESSGIHRETWGHSMIIDPWGEIVCSLQDSPGVCSATLDFELMRKIRQSMDLIGHKRL